MNKYYLYLRYYIKRAHYQVNSSLNMKFLYLSTFILIFFSCSAGNEDVFEFDLSIVFNQINFEKPSEGQVSKYIFFRGSNFSEENSAISYTTDTLEVILEILDQPYFTFHEKITEQSVVFNSTDSYILDHDIVKTSEWELVSDTLRLIGGETFLFWNADGKIALEIGNETPLVSLRDWGTDKSIEATHVGVTTGRINDFKYNDFSVSFLKLNNSGNENFELISNSPFGILRSSIYNSISLNGSGWDLQLGN